MGSRECGAGMMTQQLGELNVLSEDPSWLLEPIVDNSRPPVTSSARDLFFSGTYKYTHTNIYTHTHSHTYTDSHTLLKQYLGI